MRAIFYTDAEIDAAYHTLGPKLHEYARECRVRRPLPDPATFSAAECEQHRILTSLLTEFRDSAVRHREPLVEIYHGSPITLLAAKEVFASYAKEIVLLLSDERQAWYETILNKPDGWYVSAWVTVHDPLPDHLARELVHISPALLTGNLWLVTKARYGKASHEVWTWDGKTAEPTKYGWSQLTEEGTIDTLDLLE